MIVDHSLTAARGLVKVRRQRGKRIYDSVAFRLGWNFIAIVVYVETFPFC